MSRGVSYRLLLPPIVDFDEMLSSIFHFTPADVEFPGNTMLPEIKAEIAGFAAIEQEVMNPKLWLLCFLERMPPVRRFGLCIKLYRPLLHPSPC